MNAPLLVIALVALMGVAYVAGRRRSLGLAEAAGGVGSLHSLPGYYGF